VETLRVAIISSAVLPTPPYGYGTEIATYWLAREAAEKFSAQRYASEFAKLLKEVADGATWGT
jgi:phage gp36-like protein